VKKYIFLLIPPEGDMLSGITKHRTPEAALEIGTALALRILAPDPLDFESLRPELAALAMTKPERLELAVIDAETRVTALPGRMIGCLDDLAAAEPLRGPAHRSSRKCGGEPHREEAN